MNTKIKNTIETVLPVKFINYVRLKKMKLSSFLNLLKHYHYDFRLYHKFSGISGHTTSLNLIGEIVRRYHVIEKGLTMPQTRLGFGKDLLISLCEVCEKFILNYGNTDEQLVHAIGVILEYENFHNTQHYKLDPEVISAIRKLESYTTEIKPTFQKEMTKTVFFDKKDRDFFQFSNSRSSIRNFTEEDIPLAKILNVLELIRNTPSACNRQSWRTYVYTDKDKILKLLEIQGGNRGFGHLANKLIVVASEVGVFTGQEERNQAYIDGGIYLMNLVYSLHYNQIAACILNCSNSIEKDLELRKLSMIKDSEVFIAMVACGIPPESFKIASSTRYSLDMTNNVII